MWRGHELFVSSLPLLVEYIPATLFYFLTPTVISLVLGALICRVRVGKKNPLYWLVSLLVSFSEERRDWFRSISYFSDCRSFLNPSESISTAGMPESSIL